MSKTTRIIMHGCNGKMGQMITSLIEEDPQIEIVAGIDISHLIDHTYPVYSNIADCEVEADVVIDFASAKAADALLTYCTTRQIPCVLCTTGLSEEQLQRVKEASNQVAILKSANMSLGINMLFKLLKEAANLLVPAGFDIEIVEKHHNQKVDAPSGTALALADSINEELHGEYSYQYDRSEEHTKRPHKEIGIASIRGGTIVGEHDVIFAGTDEVITFSHTAYSKAVFGKGAIQAAKFLQGKPAGLYDMSHVIAQQ
ncbi:MAG: 4-hydroxy-tetrahydrodipicolinate reductase [Lachnospiraceae bacterium]